MIHARLGDYRLLAMSSVALAVLALGGCSGAGAGSGQQPKGLTSWFVDSAVRGYGAFPEQRFGDIRYIAQSGRPTYIALPSRKRSSNNRFIFLSEYYSGNVYEYQDVVGLPKIGEIDAAGGWGVAVAGANGTADRGDVCIGNRAGNINCFKINSRSGKLTQVSFLNISQRAMNARPYGMAFDRNGNLWAANFIAFASYPANTIDEFTPSQVATCVSGCSPTRSINANAFFQLYYLAEDGNNLFGLGFDQQLQNALACHIDTGSGNCAATPQIKRLICCFFPGGLAFDSAHNLTLNSQLDGTKKHGDLVSFAAPDYSKVSGMFAYTPETLAIALNSTEHRIWGANFYVCNGSQSCSDAQSYTYPVGGYARIGSTAVLLKAEGAGVGVAPAAGN